MGLNHYCTVCGRGMLSQIPLQTAIPSPCFSKNGNQVFPKSESCYRNMDIENIVYFELLRRGYDVSISKAENK